MTADQIHDPARLDFLPDDPPHIPEADVRKYRPIMQLPPRDPRRELLTTFYRVWWLRRSVDHVAGSYQGAPRDVMMAFGLVGNSPTCPFVAGYFAVTPHLKKLLEAWCVVTQESVAIEEMWRQRWRKLIHASAGALQEAMNQNLFDVAQLFADQIQLLAIVGRAVENRG